jgi:hypothetical protein
MEKKQLNSNVVSVAQLLSGFASVRLISASLVIELLVVPKQSHVKELENVLLGLIIQLMEPNMHWDVVFAGIVLSLSQLNLNPNQFL